MIDSINCKRKKEQAVPHSSVQGLLKTEDTTLIVRFYSCYNDKCCRPVVCSNLDIGKGFFITIKYKSLTNPLSVHLSFVVAAQHLFLIADAPL